MCKENEEKTKDKGQKEKSREEKSKKEKKMKRVRKQRKLFIFGLILLLIGCGILLYPHILQKFYKIKTESMFRQLKKRRRMSGMRILKNMPGFMKK